MILLYCTRILKKEAETHAWHWHATTVYERAPDFLHTRTTNLLLLSPELCAWRAWSAHKSARRREWQRQLELIRSAKKSFRPEAGEI